MILIAKSKSYKLISIGFETISKIKVHM